MAIIGYLHDLNCAGGRDCRCEVVVPVHRGGLPGRPTPLLRAHDLPAKVVRERTTSRRKALDKVHADE